MDRAKYSTYEIRCRAVRAVLDGMSAIDVAKAYQTHRGTIHRWLSRYKSQGDGNGLVRRQVSGRPRLLSKVDRDEWLSIILKPASKFGYETDFWTSNRICAVIEEKFKLSISKWTIWRKLRELGLTYQKPEKMYFEASEEDRQKWRQYELPKIRRAVRKYKAILYFQDESNISLSAILGKTWAPKGQTPIQKVTGKRGGIAAMSAISGTGSLIFCLHEKRIASEEIIEFLMQMLNHHKRRHLVVVMDKATPHTSKKTQAFIESQKRLHVFYLPSYSPDWNPDEKVWNHLKYQELKDHHAKTKEDLKALTDQKLSEMSNNKSQLKGIFFRCFVAELLH